MKRKDLKKRINYLCGELLAECMAAADYAAKKQQFTEGLQKALPDAKAWATQCQDCEVCLSKCPQQIRIPNQMARIVETLRK